MAVTKFVPDRVPRREDQFAAMTVWQILLQFIDWTSQQYVGQFKAGIATVPNGSANVIVTHGLGTPSYRVALVPNLVDAGQRWWVSGKTATQFQINLTAAAVGNIGFDWIVKGD
jgi:hypothetical protein